MSKQLGRPPSRPGLNSTTQRELCWFLAQGHSKEEAARKAGLPDTYRLHSFARTKDFAIELKSALLDHLTGNLAPKAIRVLDEIMSDEKVQPRVRTDAAKALLDRAGLSAGQETERRSLPNELDENQRYSMAELEAFIHRHERERALAEAGDAAKPIAQQPDVPAVPVTIEATAVEAKPDPIEEFIRRAACKSAPANP